VPAGCSSALPQLGRAAGDRCDGPPGNEPHPGRGTREKTLELPAPRFLKSKKSQGACS
jgi:hypothetical protein